MASGWRKYRRIRRMLPDCSMDRVSGCDCAQHNKVDLTVQIPHDAVLLRIFFGEDHKFGQLPLHEAIILKAREMQLGGATVLRGHVGFGHSSLIHTTKILRLSQDLPIVVEVIDAQNKIEAFLPTLDEMMTSGLVTLEKVKVLKYGTGG